jgi:CHAT domain-containing protein/tetratricopeptide (TPR) repeat protein
VVAGIRKAGVFKGDPADLLPMVFARPKDALAGARALLAQAPSPYDASIGYQVIGLVERDFGDASAALDHLRRSVRLARRSGVGDRESDALAALGIALIHVGRTPAGLAALRRAVSRAGGLTGARVRFRYGAALWLLGRHDDARAEVRRAVPTLRRARDTIWLARAITLRALIHLAYGATERADRDLRRAEQLFATTKQDHDRAVAVHNRGLVAFRAGDLPAALACLDAAGRQYRQLDTPMPELDIHRCAVLLAAGLSEQALTEADAAIERLDRAGGQATRRAELLLVAARAALAAGDAVTAQDRARGAARLFAAQRREWWGAHSQLLLLHARYAAGSSTIALLRDVEHVAQRLAALGSDESTQAHLLAGRIALALGRPVDAERSLATAARARRRGPALSRVGGWLAEALRAQATGQTRHTLDACRRGLDALDAHRLTLGASELRAQASAHGVELARMAQLTCLRTGTATRLLGWTERGRATAYAVAPVRPPQDRELQADLARYREVSSRLADARAQGQAAPPLLRERQQAERGIRERTMRMPGNGPGGRPHAALDVRSLLDTLEDGQLIQILDIDDRLHLLLCGAGRVRRYPAGTVSAVTIEVEHARSALRRLAYHAAAQPEQTGALLESTARRLQDLLLAPVEAHLGNEAVVLVPPAQLHGVPWALLPALRDTEFSVAPSASAWLRASRVTAPQRRDVLVVGGPHLPSGAVEVTSVAAAHPQTTVLAGDEATTSRVLDALDGRWLAHICAHGTFRADSPQFSALHLADGPLTVYDFERLRRGPYQLILPSCDSARLASVGGDELLGLTAALLPLGTVCIVAAVVPVNDEATVGLMLTLHGGLRRGMSMAGALRAARTAAGADPVAFATAMSFVALGAG